MADMVTKPRQMYMADINAESNWQTGLQWMQLPSDQLPKTQVRIPTGENEKKDFESELFPEIFTRDSNEEDRVLFLDAAGQPPRSSVGTRILMVRVGTPLMEGRAVVPSPACKGRCCW